MVEADADEALGLWQSMAETLKEHIHCKQSQFKEIRSITDSLAMEETLIHLDHSKKYKWKRTNFKDRVSTQISQKFSKTFPGQNEKIPGQNN